MSKTRNSLFNILIYLLLIQFLSESMNEFFYPNKSYDIYIPFGNKPQPCRNKLCEHYNELTIRKYKKTYYPVYVKGTFTCPYCGYTYGRKWIWDSYNKSGKATKPFLLKRGELFESKVLDLYEQGLNIKDISKRLGIYKEPISAFLKEKLGRNYEIRYNKSALYRQLSRNINNKSSEHKGVYNELFLGLDEVAAINFDYRILLIKRQNILNHINEDPLLSRKGIEGLARGDYRWLMKHDRDWMEKVLPKPYSRRN